MKENDLRGNDANDIGKNFRVRPVRFGLTFVRSLVGDRILFAVVILSFLFSIIYAIFSILKMYSLSASGWDLGLQSQIMYTTLHGKLFYSNLLGFSLLQEHFSPFVFVILGVFWLYQNPTTLLALQAVFVSIAAIPLYLFGRTFLRLISSKKNCFDEILLLALVVAYFLSSLTQGLIFFDFHIMSFLPFFFFLSFYAFFTGRKALNAISLVFIVSLHSNFVFIAAMVILTEYLLRRYANSKNDPEGNLTKAESGVPQKRQWYLTALTLILIFLLLFVYLVLAGYAKSLIAGSNSFDLTFHTGEVGGYSSVTGLIAGMLTNPMGVGQLLRYDLAQKLTLLYYAFGGVGFISFLSPVALLPSIPYFLYSFLTTNIAYYALGYQYPAMLLPAVFISAAVSIAKLASLSKKLGHPGSHGRNGKMIHSVVLALLVTGSMISITVDPMSPSPLYHPIDEFSTYHDPNIGVSTSTVVFLSGHINKTATILTQNNLFPFFSSFPNSYSTPWSPGVNNSTAYSFDYIIADYASSWATASNGQEPSVSTIISNDLNNHTYGIYAEGGSVLAIEKGYSAPPKFYAPLNMTFTPSMLQIDSGIILDNGTLKASNVNGSFIWNGPYISLLPGSYRISYDIGIYNFTQGSFLNVDIADQSGANTIYSHNITAGSQTTMNGFLVVSTNIIVGFPISGIEFRGYGRYNGTAYLQQISIEQLNS